MTPFFLYPFPSPKCTSEVWDQTLTSFLLPILQTISDGGGGCFLQAHRTDKSRIRLAFSSLTFFPVVTGLCSICTAQLFRLGSFHGPPQRRWSIWRGCRRLEEVFHCNLSPCLTGSSDDTCGSFTLFGRACLSQCLTTGGCFLHIFGDFGVTWGFSPDMYWARLIFFNT